MSAAVWNIVGLVLVLVGAMPTWPHSREWGYGPGGLVGLLLVVLLVLLLLDIIPWGFSSHAVVVR